MKIIQINAWLGGLYHQLMDLVDEQNPDFICLQEVFSSNISIGIDKEKYMTFEILKNKFGYGYFSPTWSFDYLGQKVGYGNAIISKYPIYDTKTLFTNGDYADLTQNKSTIKYKSFTNIRNIQSCKLDIDGKTLSIINHHGYHEPNSNGSQQSIKSMKKVIEHIKAIDDGKPLIFCGDLNLNPDSEPIKLLESSTNFRNLITENGAKTTLSKVFRIKNLNVVCDYVFTSKNIKVKDFFVSNKVVSDHKALVLDFDTK